jgi:hypothetical protein
MRCDFLNPCSPSILRLSPSAGVSNGVRSCKQALTFRHLLTLIFCNQLSGVLADEHCRGVSLIEHPRLQERGAHLRRTATVADS